MCMVKDIFWGISIHALCEEGDLQVHHLFNLGKAISIHALCEEGDPCPGFLLLRPDNFYPRPLRGGRHERKFTLSFSSEISIHALCEEGDMLGQVTSICTVAFLSTPSARRATSRFSEDFFHLRYFYPRPLRGGRQDRYHDTLIKSTFLSTPSARRATRLIGLRLRSLPYFYPRPLRGGRLQCSQSSRLGTKFLSTPSARRATSPAPLPNSTSLYFYPRPLRGGRQQKQRQNLYFQTNYTTFCTNLEEP